MRKTAKATGLLWNPEDFGYLSRKNDPVFVAALEETIKQHIDAVRYRSFESLEQFRQLVRFNWICPACKRLAPHCMWKPASNLAEWSFSFEEHHDHSSLNRFRPTLLCSMCNQYEKILIKKLDLTDRFSFSPEEISAMVARQNNTAHSKITQIEIGQAQLFVAPYLDHILYQTRRRR